jgi:hypothetical protein
MTSKRQAILDTALSLFRAYGYRMIGIDRILAESGVAKMTLYKPSPRRTRSSKPCWKRAIGISGRR